MSIIYVFILVCTLTTLVSTSNITEQIPDGDDIVPFKEKQLFTSDMWSKYPGDTVDIDIGRGYFDYSVSFWWKEYILNDGSPCIDQETSDYIFCHQALMHKYFKYGKETYTSDFVQNYHSFFEMFWIPEEDRTCVKILCMHSIDSYKEIVVNIYSIDNTTKKHNFITSLQIDKSDRIQLVDINGLTFQQHERYKLAVLIRANTYFGDETITHTYGRFGILAIRQNYNCAVSNSISDKEKQLFNVDMAQSSNPGNVIGISYINFNESFWSKELIENDGNFCKDVNKAEIIPCHECLIHSYFKIGKEFLKNSNNFVSDYHSFFEMVWRPEEGQTCIKILCAHMMDSDKEILVNISSIDDNGNLKLINSQHIDKNKRIQLAEIKGVTLKQYQKYKLSILIRANDTYGIDTLMMNYGRFGILRINQYYNCNN